MKKKAVKTRWIAALTAAVTLLGTILPMRIAALSGDDLRYDNGGSSAMTEQIGHLALIREITGEEPGKIEADYIALSGVTFDYSPVLPGGLVKVRSIEDQVTVSASDYTYTAVTGAAVRWVPTTAEMDGETVTLAGGDGTWSHTFLDVDNTADHTLIVEYEAEVVLSAALSSEIANYAYQGASDAAAAEEAYAGRVRAYEQAVTDYEAYLRRTADYQTALRKYNEYLVRAAEYEAALARRAQYEADYAEYQNEMEAYRTWGERYETYLKDLAAYEAAKAEMQEKYAVYEAENVRYQTYLAEVQKAAAVLKVIDNCFISSSGGHRMYSTLTGNTVSSVLNKRDDLIRYGNVSPQDIDAAGDSTENLISLLGEYKALKDTHAKFDWYKKNYAAVRDNFTLLYSSLSSLYKNSVVYANIQKEGRTERYCQFLSHLYLISTCLDDTFSTDYVTWGISNPVVTKWIGGPYTLNDMLATDPEYAMTDNNSADPSALEWPETVEQPVEPTLGVEKPVEPAKIPEPYPPKEVPVPEPIAPVGRPQEPAAVAAPGTRPEPPIFSAELSAVLEEMRAGRLTRREGIGETRLKLASSVTKLIASGDFAEYPVVTFLDSDRSVLRMVQIRDPGQTVDLMPTVPTDPKYTYTFLGWITEDGRPLVLSALTEDTVALPEFRKDAVTFPVTWVLAQGTFTDRVAYGTVPACGYDTSKPAAGGKVFSFIGWDRQLTAVTGEVTYRAQYAETDQVFTVRWEIGDETFESRCVSGTVPECPADPASVLPASGSRVVSFAGWDREIVPVTGDAVYRAVLNEEWIVPVTGKDGEGLETSSEAGLIAVTATGNTVDVGMGRLAALAATEGKSIRFDLPDGTTFLFPAETVKDWSEKGVTGAVLTSEKETDGCLFRFTVRVNAGTAALSAEGTEISFPYRSAPEAPAKCTASDGSGTFTAYDSYSRGERTVIAVDASHTVFALHGTHPVTVTAPGTGSLETDVGNAAEGETVTVTALPPTGYRLKEITVTRENGETVTATAAENRGTFVMPGEPVTVSAAFEPEEYTVRFLLDGEEYFTGVYHYGDTLTLPAEPTKQQTETEAFTFTGWSPTVLTTVVGNAEYTGGFRSSPLADDDYHRSPYTRVMPVTLILAALLLIGAFVAAAVIVAKRKKKKKSAGR